MQGFHALCIKSEKDYDSTRGNKFGKNFFLKNLMSIHWMFYYCRVYCIKVMIKYSECFKKIHVLHLKEKK